MSNETKRRRTRIEAQERVVEALHDFARRQQDDPEQGRHWNVSRPDVKVSGPAVLDALADIMDAFGYDVQEVQ